MRSVQRSDFGELSRVAISIQPDPGQLVCDRCGEGVNPMDPSWRHGDQWEHRCTDAHPQAGHIGVAVPRMVLPA